MLADCYLRLGKYGEVITLLQPVYDADPEDRTIDFALGMALLRTGQVQKGEAIIDRVVKNGSPAESDLLVGEAQLAAGDAKAAVPTLHKALQENPNLPIGWSLYGKALIDTGDIGGAKIALQKAIQADPNDFEANLYLGGTLRRQGNVTEAAPYLNKALQLRPASVEARFQVGMLSLAQGNLQEARKNLEQVVRDSPNFQQAHAQLAVVYARLNLPDQSKREREVVLQLDEKAREKGPAKN